MQNNEIAEEDLAIDLSFTWPLSKNTVLSIRVSGDVPSTDDVADLATLLDLAKTRITREVEKASKGQYVRYTLDGTQVTTNRIEGFWSGLKRQLNGTHHSVSRKHLHRYLSEVEFKYNNRHLTDGERTVKLIQACDHRRLTYKQQTAKNRDAKGRYTDR